VTTFDEFSASLRMVSVLSIMIFALGIFARIFAHSTVALELSTLASILIMNWFFGMLATNKTKKELANVQFRNLNGSFGFECLMAFCQAQSALLIVIFIFIFSRVKYAIIEIKALEILSVTDEGTAWDEAF